MQRPKAECSSRLSQESSNAAPAGVVVVGETLQATSLRQGGLIGDQAVLISGNFPWCTSRGGCPHI